MSRPLSIALTVFVAVTGAFASFAERPAVVFFGAHPDDTEGFAGLAFLLAKDYDLHVVDLTHGERGLGEAGLKDGSTARTRAREEESACALLGAKLHFLNEIDGEACAGKTAVEGLAKVMKDVSPVAVFTHWPLDAHADHMQCAALMANAIRRTGIKPEQYFYGFIEVFSGEPVSCRLRNSDPCGSRAGACAPFGAAFGRPHSRFAECA